MTYDARTRPHLIRPADSTGAIVPPGVYGLGVVPTGGPDGQGSVDGLVEVVGLPAGGDEAETLAKASGADGDVVWVEGSVPTILLPAGSTAADVPAGVPVPCIIRIKA